MDLGKSQPNRKLRPNKYGVAPKAARTFDGVVFASKLEGERYALLKILMGAGKIKNLRLQPEFILQDEYTTRWGEKVRRLVYRADFAYDLPDGTPIVEDTKRDATKTKEYLLKRKLLFFKFPDINFFEVKTYNAIGGLDGAVWGGKTSFCRGHDGSVPKKGPAGGVADD